MLATSTLTLTGGGPAFAAAPNNAGATSFQTEAGLNELVAMEPTNWNPHSAVTLTPPGVGASAADTAVPDDEVLDQILAPVLPSVFSIGPGLQVRLNKLFVSSAVETSTSPQTIVYRINPKATWSDGQPVTYRDFVYNWQAQSGDAAFRDTGGARFEPRSIAGYHQIASVREAGGDPDRVKVVFKSPDPSWRSLFSDLLPAHEAKKVGFDSGFADPVDDLSAGPFVVQSAVPDVSVTLVRNQRYWGTPANLAEITYHFVPDTASMLATLAAGGAQVATPAPTVGLASELAKATSKKPSDSLDLPHFTVDEVAGPDWEHLDFNEARPLVSNVAVRRAIMMAVDRRSLIAQTVGKGDASVKPLDNLVFTRGEEGYRDDSGVYGTGNVVGARTALTQAGYRYRGGQLLRRGTPVTLTITAPVGDPLLAAEEKVLARQLGAIGIRLVAHNTDDLPATLAAGRFDLALVSSQASPFLSSVASRYETDNGRGAGAENLDHYSSPATDRLLARAAATTQPAKLRQVLARLDGQLWADAVSLPLYEAPQFLVFRSNYDNLSDVAAPAGLAWDVASWGVPASA